MSLVALYWFYFLCLDYLEHDMCARIVTLVVHTGKKRPVFLNPPLLELRQLVKDQQCFLNQLHLGGHFFPLHLVELAQQPQVE